MNDTRALIYNAEHHKKRRTLADLTEVAAVIVKASGALHSNGGGGKTSPSAQELARQCVSTKACFSSTRPSAHRPVATAQCVGRGSMHQSIWLSAPGRIMWVPAQCAGPSVSCAQCASGHRPKRLLNRAQTAVSSTGNHKPTRGTRRHIRRWCLALVQEGRGPTEGGGGWRLTAPLAPPNTTAGCDVEFPGMGL